MKFSSKIFLLALCFSSHAFAKVESKFSLGLSLDEVSGVAYENVYYSGKKISELVWDIKDLHMTTLHLETPIIDRLRLRGSYGIAAGPKDYNGTMVDSDWIGASGSGYDDGNANHENWTHRSWSKVKVEDAQFFDANLSYNFFYNFSFNLGYKRTQFKWTDKAGDYVYSTFTLRDTTGNFGDQNGINYEQTMKIPYIGLEFQQPLFNNRLFFNISGAYSNQVSATSIDHHVFRSLEVNDQFRGGKYYNVGASINYMILKNMSLGFAYEYNEVKEMVGNARYTYTTGAPSFSCTTCAGLSNKYEKFSLSLKYIFDSEFNFLNFNSNEEDDYEN